MNMDAAADLNNNNNNNNNNEERGVVVGHGGENAAAGRRGGRGNNNNNNNDRQQQQENALPAEAEIEMDVHEEDGESDVDDEDVGEDDEDDEDDDDSQQDENDVHEDDDAPNNADIVEGGIAEVDEPGKQASKADISLFVVCTEHIKKFENHPILSPGVTVQIGLGKNTRLEAVFERYVKICKNKDPEHRDITVSDLEFVHSTVLKASETAEQAALMKDDRIRVRAERSLATQQEKEFIKIQRESDAHYFSQMRHLLRPDPVLANDTVLLDCRGKLQSNVHSRPRAPIPCILSLATHRCPWLRQQIETPLAYDKAFELHQKQRGLRTDGWERQAPQRSPDSAISDGQGSNASMTREEEEEEMPIRMVDRNQNIAEIPPAAAAPAAAEIEMEGEDYAEDEEMEPEAFHPVVVIHDHPPEAMALLLEYCYTNRVLSLGVEAFKVAAETKLLPREHQGNVPPFSLSSSAKRWPNRGDPTVSFDIALACLELAEEASMPRLSLMCEVAAAQLVQSSNVVSALSVCARIQSETGNELSRLRQASMDVVLHAKRSVTDKSAFRQALQEESKLLVPTLLQGLVQSMTERMDRRSLYEYENRDWQTTAYAYFDQVDRDDDYKRARERRQRRIERHPEGEQSIVVDEYEALATRKSLKRARAGGHSFRSVLRRPEKRDRRNSH